MDNKLIKSERYLPQTFSQLHEFVKTIADAGMCPKNHCGADGKPNLASMKAAIIFGDTLGVGPLASLRNVSVINGMPCVWGDLALSLVKVHPQFVDVIEEEIEGGWRCTVKRRGKKDVVRSFTVAEAKKAGLWEAQNVSDNRRKYSPWVKYPSRMLQMRARGFALRDQFPDAFSGVGITEEYIDIEVEQPLIEEKPEEKLKKLKQSHSEIVADTNEAKDSTDTSENELRSQTLRNTIGAMTEFLKETGREFPPKEIQRLGELNSVAELEKAADFYRKEIQAFENENGEVFDENAIEEGANE